MTPYQKEMLEVLRRAAERGLRVALADANDINTDDSYDKYVDLFQHILDELERIK